MKLTRDIGIDLGTANVLVYEEGRGIVLREPSVVAVDKNTGKVLQVGAAARNMLGRTPGNVVAVRPLRDGVISDYEMTEKMLEQFLKKISKFSLIKPRVIVSVPSGVTEVEERAVIQATMEAGARRVYLIEEPFAAALGAKLDIAGPSGHMVVDIGGGTTDIAVLSMNGIAVSSSIKIAGDTFDDAVIEYIRRHFGMVIGQNTAEGGQNCDWLRLSARRGSRHDGEGPRPEDRSAARRERHVDGAARCVQTPGSGELWTRCSRCWSTRRRSWWPIFRRTASCSRAAAACSTASTS